MIKNRSFMLGMGSGLIAGAMLLQLVISSGAAPLTKDQVVKGAAKLNLKVTDETAKLLTAEEWKATSEATLVTPAPSEAAVAVSPSPAASPLTAGEPSAATAPKEPVTPSQPAKVEVQQPKVTEPSSITTVTPAPPKITASGTISVRIPNGTTLTETANLLAEAGVIQDKSNFLQAANERKVNKIIQYGTYSFADDESISAIIDKLVTVK